MAKLKKLSFNGPKRTKAESIDLHTYISNPDALLRFDLAEAREALGDATVFWLYRAAAKQQLVEEIRRLLSKGQTSTEIGEALKSWVPAIKRRGKSSVEKASKFLVGMSAEEKAELKKLLGD